MSADVTVVIPCYNAERFVGQAIQSALDQGPNVEVIVVDDGSTDASLDVIASFGDRIRFETGPNRGACAARNAGLALANGQFVFFLDADDYYDGMFVPRVAESMRRYSCDIGLGLYKTVGANGKSNVTSRLTSRATRRAIFSAWARIQAAQTGAVGWRRDFLIRIGGWRDQLRKAQDIELGCRGMLAGARARVFDIGFAVYRAEMRPYRIALQNDAATVASMVEAARDLATLASNSSAADRRCIGEFAYAIARMAFRRDHVVEAREALALARELGLRGHIGSLVHIAGAFLVGFEAKERLAIYLRPPNFRRFLGGKNLQQNLGKLNLFE